MKCKRCKSTDIQIQAVTTTQVKNRGCLSWLLWILLACLTFGLILIIPLVTNTKSKNKVHSEAVCQNCGNRWKV